MAVLENYSCILSSSQRPCVSNHYLNLRGEYQTATAYHRTDDSHPEWEIPYLSSLMCPKQIEIDTNYSTG